MTASADENPDLFWALHGGGGNFGVVTCLSLRLYPLSTVTVAILLWEPEAGQEVLPAYRDFMEAAPDDLGGAAIYLTGPELGFVPPHLVGRLTLAVLVVHAGGEAEARRAMAPMLALGHTRRDDRRDALCRVPVHARRPAGLPQLLVGRVPARAAGRGAGRSSRRARRT